MGLAFRHPDHRRSIWSRLLTEMFMSLISKRHRPLRIFIIPLIAIVCFSFEFSFAEDKTAVSESLKDSNDVSVLPEDSNGVAETHEESTDVSELLEESKAVVSSNVCLSKIISAVDCGL